MIDCDVIRDLLPLYADGMSSEASNRLIKEHLPQCPQCRGLAEQMCAPMEPEPVDEVQSYLDAMHAQKKKQRRLIVIACVLPVLVCLVGFWLYMETHFAGETSAVVSTDPEKILAEMPALALTQPEKELADGILAIPVVQQTMDSGEAQDIPLDQIQQSIAPVLPEGASYIRVSVAGHVIYIDYQHEDIRVILEYLDGDGNGSVDAVCKFIGGAPGSQDSPGAREIYSLEYIIALDKTLYEKRVSKHIWFGFLDM